MKRTLVVTLACLSLVACGPGTEMVQQTCETLGEFCFTPSVNAAQRTSCGDVTEFCGAGSTPQLSCLTTMPMRPTTPAVVKLTGFVDVFSNGRSSENVQIAVYDAANLAQGTNPSALTPLQQVVAKLPDGQRACDKEAKNGCSIPSTSCVVPCGSDEYCRKDGADSTCSKLLRYEARYTLNNVPTNRQLVLRTTGESGMADTIWATVYTWNVYLSTAAPSCNGNLEANDCLDTSNPSEPIYRLNANALSQQDYVNIPVTAGLSSGISTGQGAVAGEVHDCDNVRIENASVAMTPTPDRFTFFNGDPIKTLPDASRIGAGTDRLGLYAGLNVKPGKVSVGAAGSLTKGGPLTNLGTFSAFVYPDTVSVVNINASRPQN